MAATPAAACAFLLQLCNRVFLNKHAIQFSMGLQRSHTQSQHAFQREENQLLTACNSAHAQLPQMHTNVTQ